jgi:hypothetical protein
VENFPKAMLAIQRIPEICLQRRKLAAPAFWLQQKEAWRKEFENELLRFRRKKEELGGDLQYTNRVIKSTLKVIKRKSGRFVNSRRLLSNTYHGVLVSAH